MLELAEEKMSKSVGNIVSLREALDEWGREAILVLFLGAHYRSPVEFSDDAMEQARAQAGDFATAFRVVETREGPSWDELAAALDDDFNTPEALAVLHAWRAAGRTDELRRGLALFGLGIEAPGEAPEDVRRLATDRGVARSAGDFDEADRLREEIAQLGWEVQDVEESPGFRLIPR
jgi:cysteinyl-tRNA synthetase